MRVRLHQEILYLIGLLILEPEQTLQHIDQWCSVAAFAQYSKVLVIAPSAIITQLNGILLLLCQPLLTLGQPSRPIKFYAHAPRQQVYIIKGCRNLAIEESSRYIEAGHSIYSGDVHSSCFPCFTLFCRAEQPLQHMLCYLALNFTKIGGRIHFIAIGHLHPCKLCISTQSCTKRCNNEVSPRYSCFNQCIESLTDDAGKLWSHLTHIVARLLALPPTRYEE